MDSSSVLSQGPQVFGWVGPKKAKVGIPFAALKCITPVSTPTNARALEFSKETSARERFPLKERGLVLVSCRIFWSFSDSLGSFEAVRTHGIW